MATSFGSLIRVTVWNWSAYGGCRSTPWPMVFSHLKSILMMLVTRSGSLICIIVYEYRLTAKHKLGVDARFMFCPTPDSVAQPSQPVHSHTKPVWVVLLSDCTLCVSDFRSLFCVTVLNLAASIECLPDARWVWLACAVYVLHNTRDPVAQPDRSAGGGVTKTTLSSCTITKIHVFITTTLFAWFVGLCQAGMCICEQIDSILDDKIL